MKGILTERQPGIVSLGSRKESTVIDYESRRFVFGDTLGTHSASPSGNTLTLALAREPGRVTWITRRDYAFNGSPLYWHRTTYDAEGRPTETEDSLSSTRLWIYNRRSELVGATGTQAHPFDYAYSYDSIGNRLTSSDNFGSATYAANGRNWSSKQKSGTRHCLISA